MQIRGKIVARTGRRRVADADAEAASLDARKTKHTKNIHRCLPVYSPPPPQTRRAVCAPKGISGPETMETGYAGRSAGPTRHHRWPVHNHARRSVPLALFEQHGVHKPRILAMTDSVSEESKAVRDRRVSAKDPLVDDQHAPKLPCEPTGAVGCKSVPQARTLSSSPSTIAAHTLHERVHTGPRSASSSPGQPSRRNSTTSCTP